VNKAKDPVTLVAGSFLLGDKPVELALVRDVCLVVVDPMPLWQTR
jgi:hypothetical protein